MKVSMVDLAERGCPTLGSSNVRRLVPAGGVLAQTISHAPLAAFTSVPGPHVSGGEGGDGGCEGGLGGLGEGGGKGGGDGEGGGGDGEGGGGEGEGGGGEGEGGGGDGEGGSGDGEGGGGSAGGDGERPMMLSAVSVEPLRSALARLASVKSMVEGA